MAEVPEEQPVIRPIVGLLPERNGVPSAAIFFDMIAIAQRGWPFIRTDYGDTIVQRNKFAEHLMASDFTHLLMLDADHRHPPDIVERLTRWVKQDPTRLVVAGLCFRRGVPFDPNVFIVNGAENAIYQPAEWGRGLMQVDIAGTAEMLIAREVFERLPKPWFARDYSGAAEGKWPGEDVWFSQRCGELGVDIWVDTTTTGPHLMESWVDAQTYRTYAAMTTPPARGMTEADLTGA